MRYFLLILLLTVASCTKVQSEQTPEEIVMAFFGPSGISNKADCYAGEMLDHYMDEQTLGEYLSPEVKVNIRPLSKTPEECVLAVALAMDGSTEDWYAYLIRQNDRWKLEAVRTLSLTSVPAMLLEELEQKSQRTDEEEWSLQNLKLMFKSDAELKRYVASNIKDLEEVIALQKAGQKKEARTAARRLFIDVIMIQPDGRIELIIGGIVDNAVGITYVPKGTTPPTISSDNYIYIEHVKDGWYIFKTT